jgi:SAM-dependent methyltransferase
MTRYESEFYAHRHRDTAPSAEAVLSAALAVLPPVRSAVDIGCGVGTWLACLRSKGAEEILGLDGPWMDPVHLIIPREAFRHADLGQPIRLERRFDLALSLEVAEHLPPGRAGSFVADLCALADFVLFAAAIPHQGGVGHVNEQWPAYWAALFAKRGYAPVDAVRPRVWDDGAVQVWYRQNTLLYAKRTRLPEVKAPEAVPMALIHPALYLEKTGTLLGAWKVLSRRFRDSLRPKS